MKLYRIITGPDDNAFCHRISNALSKGWQLHGSGSLTFDSSQNRVICGQAIVKEVPGQDYHDDLTLSDF
ncbi:MAG: DUF1737 domain-containing protein [Rhizobiaceae bacterium]|nr:DUF1737 domain-containing protein [Rhizobiaceae bacterium]